MRRRAGAAAGVAVTVAAVVAVGQTGSIFTQLLFTEILIMGLFAASFNLLFGYGGLLSFGHAAFFGGGAYAAALLLRDLEVPFLAVLAAGFGAGALLGVVIGYFSVRLNEVYFAMLTLAFDMLVYTVVHQWRSYTGGSDGVTGFVLTPLLPGVVEDLAHPTRYYYLTAIVVAASLLVLFRIVRSPFGLVLRATKDNAERVAFTGVPVFRLRLAAFVVSAAFTGLAGALYGPFSRVVSPDMVHWTRSADPVLMTVLGGSEAFLGPVIGAATFLLVRTWVTRLTPFWMLPVGVLTIVLVLAAPRGVAGSLGAALGRLGKMMAAFTPASRQVVRREPQGSRDA